MKNDEKHEKFKILGSKTQKNCIKKNNRTDKIATNFV